MIDMNRGRNCYSCGGSGYLAQNYKNWRIVDQERRIEYGNNRNISNNLKEEENLVVLN